MVGTNANTNRNRNRIQQQQFPWWKDPSDIDCVFQVSEHEAYLYTTVKSSHHHRENDVSHEFLGRLDSHNDNEGGSMWIYAMPLVSEHDFLSTREDDAVPSVLCNPTDGYFERHSTGRPIYISLFAAAIVVVSSVLYFVWNDRCCYASRSGR